jgi:predicted permease
MARLRHFLARLINVFRSTRAEDEMHREVASHFDLMEDEFRRKGLSAEEARLATRRAFGGVEQVKEAHRHARSFPELEAIRRDVGFAARLLRRTPGFTVVAILTLGTAIGACTAIYSIVYGVVLAPLAYPHSEQIVQLEQVDARGRHGRNFSDPNFEDVRDQTTGFSALAEFNQFGFASVVAGDVPLRARLANVSRRFFDVLSIEPVIGRRFSDDESHEGGPRAIIVSLPFWREHFGAAPDVSNATLKVDGERYAIVGVMPAGFAFPPDTDLWTPREARSRNPFRTGHNWRVVGRLRPGVSLVAARTEATLVAHRLKAQYGEGTMMSDVAIVPLRDELVGDVRPALLLLFASVGLLLVVACANLANVLLARLTARRREMAVRAALGATGMDLMRPLVAESVMVSACGGLVGMGMAWLAVQSRALIQAPGLPHVGDIRLNWPVLVFAITVTSVTAIGLSLVAAFHERRGDIVSSLHDVSRGQTAGRSVGRLRSGLVVAQLVVSVVLVVGAGLLGRSLVALLRQNLGLRTTGVLAIDVMSPRPHEHITPGGLQFDDPSALPRQARQNEQTIDRLAALPGVVDVGGTSDFPLAGAGADGLFVVVPPGDHTIEKLPLSALDTLRRDGSQTGAADFRVASAGYFRTVGIPLLRGRLFDDRDGPSTPHVAVISESLARTRWPNLDPIGVRIEFGGMDGDMRVFTIVGVVGDVRGHGFDTPPPPTFYADYRQRPLGTFDFTFVVRTARAPTAIIADARRVIHDLAPELPPRFRTVDELVEQSVAGRRFTLMLAVLFAVSALLVAVLGVYSVMAFLVAERSHEFGIRMALGAQGADVQRLVLGHAARLLMLGLTVGMGFALFVTRALSSQLFGIGPSDPVTYAWAVAILAFATFIAGELPARRATKVDPMVALRCD